MGKIKSVLLIIVLVTSVKTSAQTNDPLFYHLQSGFGLVSDRTTAILQDHQGFIWIGTEEGLARYTGLAGTEGYQYTTYKFSTADSTTINNNYILSLFQDSKNNLWVGTLDGLCRYDFQRDQFERIILPDTELYSLEIKTIAEYRNLLWLGTGDRLYAYDPAGKSVINTYGLSNGSRNTGSVNALMTHRDTLWVGMDSGLFKIVEEKMVAADKVPSADVICLEEMDGSLLAGTRSDGIILRTDSTVTILNTRNVPGMVSDRVNDLKVRSDGIIWVATDAGINLLDKRTFTVKETYRYDFNNWHGLADPETRQIFEDDTKGLWLSTPMGGVGLYHDVDNLFTYYTQKTENPGEKELLDYSVLSLLADSTESRLWIGSRKGISAFDPRNNKFTHYPISPGEKNYSNQVLSICKVSENLLWLGTEKGLFQWDKLTGSYTRPRQFPENNWVTAIAKDHSGGIWVGTRNQGLFYLPAGAKEAREIRLPNHENPGKLSIKGINAILQRGEHTFIGTSYGLFYSRNSILKKYIFEGNSVRTPWISSLVLSSSGDLLITTREYGLLQLNQDLDARIAAKKECGLPSNNLASAVYDPIGQNWWVAGDKGLSNLEFRADSTRVLDSYFVFDGLQGTQFTPAAGVYLNGKLFFGGVGGLTVFNSNQVTLRNYPLKLNLARLYVNDQPVKPGDSTNILDITLNETPEITLQPWHTKVAISFQGMDYLRPDSLIYKYKLENYDPEWIQTSANKITYTSLERGKTYTFKVMAKSRLRDWSNVRSLELHMVPYFTETTAFKVLVLVAVLLLLLLLYLLASYRNRKRREELEILVRTRTEALRTQVEEKEKTASALAVAAEEAKKADKAKSEFLAKISHEMRTPLNGIMGLAQMAREQDNREERNELMDMVYRSSQSLKGIIDDLLDFGKLEFEKLEIFEEDLDLRKLLKDITGSFTSQMKGGEVELRYHIDDEIPERLLGDLLRLRQVLVNLVGNALKFTDCGYVQVTAEKIAGNKESVKIRFSIRDTGIGIPKSKRDLIFGSFEQIDNGATRRYGGTGLGLAISQRLVNLMGGEIKVKANQGGGSLFTFVVNLRINPGTTASPEAKDINLPENKRILLVEDNPTNILVASKMLEKAKQLVDTASNGRSALEKLQVNTYDLVLMDIQMPVMDGYEATQLIRKSGEAYSSIVIIALTAGVMHNDVKKYLEIGMNDVLSKPVDYNDLLNTLRKYL